MRTQLYSEAAYNISAVKGIITYKKYTFLDGPSFIIIGFIFVSKDSIRFLCWASKSSLNAAHTSSNGAVFVCSSFSRSSQITES